MAWVVLLVSAIFEAIWATALGMSNGFTEPAPTIVFLLALAVSMAGLGWAVTRIPIGTAYAVWVGVGAALTVIWAMGTGVESISVGKVVCLVGIIGAVIGLKLAPNASSAGAKSAPPGEESGAGH